MDNIDALTRKLKARLRAAEPDHRGYKSVNDSTNALGLYQFVPKYHWSRIKALAIKNGYGSPDEITHDFFLNNPDLQEEYFEEYVKTDIAPKLEEVTPYNTRGLDLDEIAQLIHLRPESVKKYLEGGEFYLSNPDKNMTIPEYLAEGDKGLQNSGLGHLKASELMSEQEIQESVKQYVLDSNNLNLSRNNGKLSDGAFTRKMQTLKKEYASKGLTSDINRQLKLEIAERGKMYNQERQDAKELWAILSNKEPGQKEGWFGTGNPYTKQYDKEKNRLTIKAGNAAIEELVQKHGFRRNTKTIDKGKYKEHYKLNEITIDLNGNGPNAKKFLEKINKFTKEPITYERLQKSSGLGFQHSQKYFDNDLVKLDKNYEEEAFNIINPAIVDSQNVKNYDTGKAVTPKTIEKKVEQDTVDSAKDTTPTDQVTAEGLTEFYNEIDAPLQADYNPDDFKKEIPFGAAVQGFLGAMGMAQADKEIPKRDEKIGAGMENYIKELQEITRIGLPPALEAQAKNDLAEAYQLGLENIVRASGGNRNLVLGNQSQLDLSKMEAGQNLKIADFEAKVQAANKYGEAMKYVNEFNANRDIANKQLEQNLALQDREAGGQLAAIGFNNMLKSIQDQRERAPGTPYHMLMSSMSMDAFGEINGMKDDNTGTKPGTRSYKEAQKALFNKENESIKGYRSLVGGFDQERLNKVNEFSKMTNDPNELYRFADLLSTNNPGDVNLSNFEKARANNDYSWLMQSEPTPKQEPLPNVQSFGFKPF